MTSKENKLAEDMAVETIQPAAETVETPVTEDSKLEDIAAVEPDAAVKAEAAPEEPAATEPEAPANEETVAAEPKADETKTEEAVAAEPKVEESEAPASEEPVAVEAKAEETAPAEAKAPASEEPKAAEKPTAEKTAPAEAKAEVNLAEKSLSELSDIFRQLMDSADRMTRSKEAEAIKSAFYRLLLKLKSEAGEAGEKFDEVEENFKAIYSDYKRERAEYNKEQEARKSENLEKKKAIIEELKALVDNQEDVSASFPAFRELQNRWREVGPVPASEYRNLNSTYQFNVEKFYDMVKINRDLRDLDFKKNLEAKEKFCEEAEKLAGHENVVSAFNDLQKLHEQWKEFGPVAKEFRESIWARFQAATSVINKKYQAHFEALKDKQKENLAAKTRLCEQVEEIASMDVVTTSEWSSLSAKIRNIQEQWRKIGFATKKENQKIYDRFRAGCDAFYNKKKLFYDQFKDEMEENVKKKEEIIRQAEELKTSTDWKKTTDQFIALQKQWKEIGNVTRKKSEALWKRFRGACDEFFAARDAAAPQENNYYANLKSKKQIIEDIRAYESKDATADSEAMYGFAERWRAIGFVPFKEKDAVNAAYAEAMKAKFPSFRESAFREQRGGRQENRPLSAKEQLIRKYNALQQEIETYENNIGFFAASKNSEALIAKMKQKIGKSKEDLAALKEQIRKAEEGAE